MNTLKNILQIFRKYNVRLNGPKCEFLYEKVKFLGRIVDREGFTADPENVAAVKALAPPTSRKETQQAIGRFGWLKDFISTNIGEEVGKFCFSELISELNKLNRNDVKFKWTEKAQKSFENAKDRLSSNKCISFANFNLPFTLITDASGIAVAGILLQIENSKQKIIGCISKTLSQTEQRWSATEREAYAILYSIEKFSYFLKGPKPFILLTDHKSLTYMDKSVFSNAEIARWQDRLSSYNFICQYIEGVKNISQTCSQGHFCLCKNQK